MITHFSLGSVTKTYPLLSFQVIAVAFILSCILRLPDNDGEDCDEDSLVPQVSLENCK